MITWRCSLAAAALALAGCAEGTAPAFLSGGGLSRAAEPLREVRLARGAVTLVAPEGYCIDPGARRADFAALARCDTLGGDGPAGDVPLALVTVSLMPGDALPGPAAPAGADLLDERQSGTLRLARLRGAALRDGYSPIHWRGAGQLDGFAVGLAAYGPDGGAVTGDAGARLLGAVMEGLQSAAPVAVQTEDPAAAPPPAPAGNALWPRISGLFD